MDTSNIYNRINIQTAVLKQDLIDVFSNISNNNYKIQFYRNYRLEAITLKQVHLRVVLIIKTTSRVGKDRSKGIWKRNLQAVGNPIETLQAVENPIKTLQAVGNPWSG